MKIPSYYTPVGGGDGQTYVVNIPAMEKRIAELEAAITRALEHADSQGMRDWPVFTNLRKAIGKRLRWTE